AELTSLLLRALAGRVEGTAAGQDRVAPADDRRPLVALGHDELVELHRLRRDGTEREPLAVLATAGRGGLGTDRLSAHHDGGRGRRDAAQHDTSAQSLGRDVT